MSEGEFEELKGRAKKAAGAASGDEDLEREGEVDRVAGATKSKLTDAIDWIKDRFRRT